MDRTEAAQTLGLHAGADHDAIKAAYRRAVRDHHPDLHRDDPNAGERFRRINEAYDVLMAPDKSLPVWIEVGLDKASSPAATTFLKEVFGRDCGEAISASIKVFNEIAKRRKR